MLHEKNKPSGIITDDDFFIPVDYGIKGDKLFADEEAKKPTKKEALIERHFAIIEMGTEATDEEVLAEINRLGYVPVNAYELQAFRQEEFTKFLLPLAAVGVRTDGNCFILLQKVGTSIGDKFEALPAQIPKEVHHLVIKNEALFPIL